MQGHKKILLLMLILVMGTVVGCDKNQPEKKVENQYQIYYSNNTGTELVSKPYLAKSTNPDDLVNELMNALSKEPDSLKCKTIKPDDVELLTFERNDTGQLTLHFSSEYSSLTGISEILLRAAVVKMLCQIDGVNSVEIYVEDQPLMETADKPFGFETAEDFIDNTGRNTNFSQNVTMSLYFSNQSGDALDEVRVNVKYDGTVSLEQLIIERLIDGPRAIDGLDPDLVKATIPKGTKLVKTSIREGVCYVYFNDKFYNKLADITDETAIYSVVNSLCEMSTINKVQFMIEGKVNSTFRDKNVFDSPFERNLDLVQS